MEDSPTMETETHHAPDSEFGHSPWVDLGAFTSPQNSPPIPEYSGHALAFLAQHARQPIAISRVGNAACACPNVGLAFGANASHSHTENIDGGSTPRRTLTDEDRRLMCLYHEENKTAKQTDIGALFGVERSTVSKVLRQKEKYLNRDDGSRSPIKRAKGRVPDIEKALTNWARNYQRQGFPLSDEMIKEKALFFASTCGCPEGKDKVLTSAWLEKFKNKNNLAGAKARKGSIDVRSGSNSPTRINTDSAGESTGHSPRGLSPSSPNGLPVSSPLSPAHSEEDKKERADSVPDLAGGYQHNHSKSTTSLDTTSSTAMTSPTSTLVSDSPFTPTSQTRLPTGMPGSNTNRPRSQTFPLVPIDPSLLSHDESIDPQCTKPGFHRSISVATVESPLEMDDHPDTGSNQPNVIKRNRSNPEIKTKAMQPPPPSFSSSNTVSPILSPGSPTQDEARRALELVMNYFQQQPAGLQAQEYFTIGKLMERLELAKNQHNIVLGGLPRIDEHDVPHMSKKRSIHNLG
ncbi:hypothetical protein N7510_001844 [Penicillium lagena]|uniref:uncharacterized protein n=1 Tax=Penicillium lagena TaxID=94218 RepID=UPI00254040DD|nr:uncharacterized protein N7510_001844 [Penicillium lagena]KAJ5625535.1 hypothetical protein N7510_001844 [Penicillium lagena]